MYSNRVIKYEKNFIIPQEIMEKILRYNVMNELLELYKDCGECEKCFRQMTKIVKYIECVDCGHKICDSVQSKIKLCDVYADFTEFNCFRYCYSSQGMKCIACFYY